jgi:glutaminase
LAFIAVWSPALTAEGSSLVGTEVLEQIAVQTGWSIF